MSLRRRVLLEREYPPSGPPSEPKEYTVALDRSYFGGQKGEIGWKQTVKAISREAAAQTVWNKMERALLRLIRKGIKKVALYVNDPEMTTKGTLTLLPPITVYNEDEDKLDTIRRMRLELLGG